MSHVLLITIMLLSVSVSACSDESPQILVTIADAREKPALLLDTGESGDSAGDVLTFDQPLLDSSMRVIGSNSGTCTRTRVGHSFQCQWTLIFDNGSIQVAGREFDQGMSTLSIVGGTGDYAGISGELETTNNNDGTFTQVLRYSIR
jgi:hypothetical protein